jgi:hypothetical protein
MCETLWRAGAMRKTLWRADAMRETLWRADAMRETRIVNPANFPDNNESTSVFKAASGPLAARWRAGIFY